MAKRKDTKPSRFRVGQRAMLVLDKESGYERFAGQLVRIIRAPVHGVWDCFDPQNPERPPQIDQGWRYEVIGRGCNLLVEEGHLREIFDGEKLSTWEKFVKTTGIDLRKEVAHG